jgi:UDP:flavonoid glycosyltransferase YjiC (YdhE family)
LFKADATLLLTFRELDHYPQRSGDAEYLGIPLQADFGQAPEWPAMNGKRVFAYLYPFRTLSSLLQTIAGSEVSAIIFAPEVRHAVKEKNASPRIAYPDQPVRIMEVMQQCDIAVTNGTHATTATALLAGKPVLMMPNNLERFLGARRVVELGAGLSAPQLKPGGMAAKFGALLNSDQYAINARKFAETHADFNPERQLARMLEIVRSQL